MKAFDAITGEAVEARFATQYVRPQKDESEKLPTRSNVERAYIPPEDQIREMLSSGERLAAARRAMYAPEDELEREEELLVGGGMGSDLVDAGRVLEQIKAMRLAQQAKADKEAADAAKAAEEQKVQELVRIRLEEMQKPKAGDPAGAPAPETH